MSGFILEAHRGVASEFTDNSMPAYRAAVEQGYGMIELDTKFTADNRCVLLHNSTINQTARHIDGSPIDREKEGDIAVSTLEYSALAGYTFGGMPIPTLEDVLALAKESGVPLKFDNVIRRHTPEQLDIFLSTIKNMQAQDYVGFTTDSVEFAAECLLPVFPQAHIHYDGMFTDEAFAALKAILPPEQLTIWQRFDNARTSWNKTEPVSVISSEKIHSAASLGLWILTEKAELKDAIELYRADIVETDGRLKPSDAKEITDRIL